MVDRNGKLRCAQFGGCWLEKAGGRLNKQKQNILGVWVEECIWLSLLVLSCRKEVRIKDKLVVIDLILVWADCFIGCDLASGLVVARCGSEFYSCLWSCPFMYASFSVRCYRTYSREKGRAGPWEKALEIELTSEVP